MFKKVAADMLGLSDIGSVIKPVDYDKVDADDYVMHEDDEKIYFLIKSKSDEYCFTNKAIIHLDGTSAMSKKRTLRRYSYAEHNIAGVVLETAGTVDLDIEIKFVIGEVPFSIDVHKKYIEELKDLYKALIKISEVCRENATSLDYAVQSLSLASNTFAASFCVNSARSATAFTNSVLFILIHLDFMILLCRNLNIAYTSSIF